MRGRPALVLVLAQVEIPPLCAGVLDGPLVRHEGEPLGVVEQHLGDLGVLGVLGVRELEEHADGEEGGLDGLDGGPTRAEGVEADCTLRGGREGSSVSWMNWLLKGGGQRVSR